MSEDWAQLIMCGLIGWVAWELRDIKKELKMYVRREDCKDDMGNHCEQINELRERVNNNEADIKSLAAKAQVWHKDEN